MAQGQHKKKSASAKKTTSRKPLRPKKGGRTIAPKKTKHVKAAKMKKGLEKAIKAKIESDVVQAASKEAKPFRVVKPSVDDGNQKSAGERSNNKGRGKTRK